MQLKHNNEAISQLSKLAFEVSYPSFVVGYPFPKVILLCRQHLRHLYCFGYGFRITKFRNDNLFRNSNPDIILRRKVMPNLDTNEAI